jgi:hypothetical protein
MQHGCRQWSMAMATTMAARRSSNIMHLHLFDCSPDLANMPSLRGHGSSHETYE